jgi:hypothetical protein
MPLNTEGLVEGINLHFVTLINELMDYANKLPSTDEATLLYGSSLCQCGGG